MLIFCGNSLYLGEGKTPKKAGRGGGGPPDIIFRRLSIFVPFEFGIAAL
jgi:hypothetical protein